MTQAEFVQLILEHNGLIQKVCNLYAATLPDRQDLYQEIIIQLWRAYPKFRGDSKLSTWMYRVALNTAISDYRKQQRTVVTTGFDLINKEIADHNSSNDIEEKIKLLYEAIRHLPEIEKAIVMLYLEDKPYEEMEDILGINQNNLRVKMNRIKEKLRQLTKAEKYGT
ncbi:MAG: polymerase, sigma-24 subunit, subfamily [Chitinophagaceae bacterium]|nr:polymerase, sigma-24 subunit, subfamily [Chitinophagaceae bacterium]